MCVTSIQSGGCRGHTLVELSIVILAMVVLAAAIAPDLVRRSRAEKNYRHEAFVRSRLVLHLGKIEQYLSLATNAVFAGEAIRAGFPRETGGVAFETNRVARVSRVSCLRDGESVDTEVTRQNDDLATVQEDRPHMDASPLYLDFALPARLCEMAVEGVGSVRLVRLSAEVPWVHADGQTSCRTVSVSRVVRLWNCAQ